MKHWAPEVKLLARELWVKCTSIRQLSEELKNRGGREFAVPARTLEKWFRDPATRAEWNSNKRETLENEKKMKSNVSQYIPELFRRLQEMEQNLSRVLNEKISAGEMPDVQKFHPYKAVVSEIRALAAAEQALEKGDVFSEALVNVLIADSEIGPILKQRYEIVMGKVETEREKLQKRKKKK